MAYQIITKGTQVDLKVANTPDFASLAEAEAWIVEKFGKLLAYFEIDVENDAADFITTIGGIYAVEAR